MARGFFLHQASAPAHLTGLLEEARTNRSPRPKRELVKPPEASLCLCPPCWGALSWATQAAVPKPFPWVPLELTKLKPHKPLAVMPSCSFKANSLLISIQWRNSMNTSSHAEAQSSSSAQGCQAGRDGSTLLLRGWAASPLGSCRHLHSSQLSGSKWPVSWAQNKILPTLQGQYYDWKIRSSLSHPSPCGSVTLRYTPHHKQSSVWSIHKAVFTRVFCADGAWTARRISTALWTISFHFVPDRSETDWKILLIQIGLCRETPYLCTGQNKWNW